MLTIAPSSNYVAPTASLATQPIFSFLSDAPFEKQETAMGISGGARLQSPISQENSEAKSGKLKINL